MIWNIYRATVSRTAAACVDIGSTTCVFLAILYVCTDSDYCTGSYLRFMEHSVKVDVPTLSDNTSRRSELLCFMQQKSAILTAEHLVKICNDFYRKEEVIAARTLIEQLLNKRLPKRQGSDMIRRPIRHWRTFWRRVSIPTLCCRFCMSWMFIAFHLLMWLTHCDVSAILRELQALRAEVRELADLREELQKLKQSAQPPCLSLPSDGVEGQDTAL